MGSSTPSGAMDGSLRQIAETLARGYLRLRTIDRTDDENCPQLDGSDRSRTSLKPLDWVGSQSDDSDNGHTVNLPQSKEL